MSYKRKQALTFAVRTTIPVMCGYLFLGVAFGVMLQTAGYNFIWAFSISLLVYAGSMQFVMIPLLVAAASPLTVAVTTLLVNSRHLFYGLSFVESFRHIKQRMYLIFSLTDETYSLLCGCRGNTDEHREAWIWIAALDHFYWVIGSTLGALLGQALPFDFSGIEFAMTALFIVILIDQMRDKKTSAGRSALVGLISGVACLFIFGVDRFLLPSMLITVLLLSTFCLHSQRYDHKENDA